MMKKKVMKFFIVVLIILITALTCTNVFGFEGMIKQVDESAKTAEIDEATASITKAGAEARALVRNIAIVTAVICLIIIGIKYMLGSAEEKAGYKKSLIPLVIGIVIVVAATTIITIAIDVGEGLGKEHTGGGGADPYIDNPPVGPTIFITQN